MKKQFFYPNFHQGKLGSKLNEKIYYYKLYYYIIIYYIVI